MRYAPIMIAALLLASGIATMVLALTPTDRRRNVWWAMSIAVFVVAWAVVWWPPWAVAIAFLGLVALVMIAKAVFFVRANREEPTP